MTRKVRNRTEGVPAVRLGRDTADAALAWIARRRPGYTAFAEGEAVFFMSCGVVECATPGDWIYEGGDGELRPCPNMDFVKRFRPAREAVR
jgi:hypothetical protein